MSQSANERVTFRVTPEERERFEQYVENSSKYASMSQLVRDAVLREVRE
jgi:Arc/MetJ-type ribon-helix-helix transcriptional regulator